MKIILVLSLIAMGAGQSKKEEPQNMDEPMICSTDVKTCADGSFVSRDSKKGCEFKPCASEPKKIKELKENSSKQD